MDNRFGRAAWGKKGGRARKAGTRAEGAREGNCSRGEKVQPEIENLRVEEGGKSTGGLIRRDEHPTRDSLNQVLYPIARGGRGGAASGRLRGTWRRRLSTARKARTHKGGSKREMTGGKGALLSCVGGRV